MEGARTLGQKREVMPYPDSSSKLREGQDLPWPMKALFLSLALLLGFLDHTLHGWGRAVFAAGIALTAPVIGYRRFWGKGRFWVTVMLLTAAQIPAVITMRPLLEMSRLPGMLAFAVVDCVSATLIIAWVCSKEG
jgi:hypothetical protein